LRKENPFDAATVGKGVAPQRAICPDSGEPFNWTSASFDKVLAKRSEHLPTAAETDSVTILWGPLLRTC